MRRTHLALLLVTLLGCESSSGSEPKAKQQPNATSAQQSAASTVTAPPLSGRKAGGGSFSLADVRDERTVLLFLRGSYCGLCRDRLKELTENKSAYDNAGAKVIVVTLDQPDVAERTRDQLNGKYEAVSAQPEVFRAWGLWKAGEPWPRPAEFVLNEQGRVVFGHVGATAADMSSDVELLGALSRM